MQGMEDLKVFRCICGARCKITAHKDGRYTVQCLDRTCAAEYFFQDEHPYFNHENARTEIGDYVIFEAFKKQQGVSLDNQNSKMDANQVKSVHPFIKVDATKSESEATINQGVHPPMRNGVHHSSLQDNIELDKLDHHILILVSERCHERGIVRLTKRPRSTIQKRLTRLQRRGFIKPYYFQTVFQKVKLYDLTQKAEQFLIYNEERQRGTSQDAHTMTTHTPFTTHAMAFKFPILEGEQPKSPKAYRMNNWTGYTFDYTNHTVRSTPSNIIVDVNLTLIADSVDNLVLKYSQLAQKYAVEFAERHKIVIGACQKYKNPHYETKSIPFIQLIAERGEFQTPDLKIDKSRSNGDLEFNEQSARGFEFIVNDMPKEVSEIKNRLNEIMKILEPQNKKQHNTLIDYIAKQKK